MRTLFLPGVPADAVIERLNRAGGDEVRSGKLSSPESSAALAVNTFGWFTPRPRLLPPLTGMAADSPAAIVDVEYCARFPWAGGRHPWLDAMIQSESTLIGVESKRFEPFRGKKAVALSPAYDRPVWGDRMGPFEAVRDLLRAGELRFTYLDAAQLIKHALGLVTDARRQGLSPHLHYLFAEPALLNGRAIPALAFAHHRDEIGVFERLVRGAEVTFSACSYREWIATWPNNGDEVALHGQRVLETFQP